MKNTIFMGLMLLSAPTLVNANFGIESIRDHFCGNIETLSHIDQVTKAIKCGDVKQVLKLVKADNTSKNDLKDFIQIAEQNFGKAPEAEFRSKVIGSLRLILGGAMVFKAFDYFRKEYKAEVAVDSSKSLFNILLSRYSDAYGYNLVLDVASIGSFLSSYGTICLALRTIKPKAEFKDHLLIQLYLKNLTKSVK